VSDSLVFDHYPFSRSDVPRGWALVSLGQIAKMIGSGFPSGKHNQNARGVPHIRPMNIDRDGRLDLSLLKFVEGEIPRSLQNGDVVFNNTNSPELIGKTTAVLVDTHLAYSNHMTCIRLEDGINSTFIARQLHFLWMCGYFRHRCLNHVNQASISTDPLSKTVPIFLPPPAEQERIADALDELLSDLDAGVAALKRVRDKLKLYRSAVLKAAVEGALTTEWRKQHPRAEPASNLVKRILAERRRHWEEKQLHKFGEDGRSPPTGWQARYKEPAAPNGRELRKLPVGWCWTTVEQVGEVRLGRQRAPQHHRGDHMRPYLRVANVYEDRLDLSDVKMMNFTPAEFVTYSLRKGDILLNEGQSPELVGRPAMFRGEIPDCCYQKTLLRFRSANGLAAPFALIVFRAYLHNGRFRKSANITTSIAHLAAERFNVIELPLPPRAEQEVIVEAVEDQLSIVDHLETDLVAKLENAEALRQSIFREAFSGGLVHQNTKDEAASALLKRVAAAREQRESRATVNLLSCDKSRDGGKIRKNVRANSSRGKARGHGRIADR
jgi:type I restriction enzyme S subunit